MAIRNPRLPLLPGYGTNTMIGKKSFGVRPVFTSIDKVNMLVDKAESGNRVPSFYARKQAPELPSWIMYDKNNVLGLGTTLGGTIYILGGNVVRGVIYLRNIWIAMED